MRTHRILPLLLILLAPALRAHVESYRDVAVIINTASPQSESIGTYFADQRNIPAINRIRIAVPVTEEIDSVQFEEMRRQVEAYITANNLKDSLNYLVTTKGMPLKVKRADVTRCSSVESDLGLILSSYAGMIGSSGRVSNPYFRSRTDFSHTSYGYYLVTRLDGYTTADVISLIDRTEQIAAALPSSGTFVFDQDPAWTSVVPTLNSRMRVASDTLRRRGMTTMLDTLASFVTGVSGVNGYVSWGSNDHAMTDHGRTHMSWNHGAIAETYVSTSARSFTPNTPYGQSLIADLLQEGCSAAKGYVYEPYSSAMADVSVLFDLYSSGYTVAESYYASSPYLSWMDVVVGDPKFRLLSVRMTPDAADNNEGTSTDALPVELTSFRAVVMGGAVRLSWSTATERENAAFLVERNGAGGAWVSVGSVPGHGTTAVPQQYQWTDQNATGSVRYRLTQVDRNGSRTIVGEARTETPGTFGLQQNFPNPFNPSTTIRFSVPVTERMTVSIYDMTGRMIAVVFDGVAAAGEMYAVPFDGASLANGVYLCALQSSSRNEVRKMTLLK